MQRGIRIILCVLVITLVLLCTFSCSFNDTNNEEAISVSIDVLKIGKADCIIINTGSKVVMIDTGELENIDEIDTYMVLIVMG